MKDLPDGVLGASASGEVSAGDYRHVLVPAIERALVDGAGKVRLLYQLGPDFKRIRPDAMWQDARLGASHMRAFERVALVTDVDWIKNATHAFAWLIPGDVRSFGNDQFGDAVSWLAH